MVEVNWTFQSVNDIENIADFISKDSERYAQIQVQRFFEAAEILHTNPEAGRIVPELNNQLIREVILGNYRIIYTLIAKDLIHILTVHHSKRLLSNNPAFQKNK
ncbi:MAG TPA: type II toxin-antitoxin system RelE/ParE family toxin [Sphingobacteriaceae bacterium]|nr:type II toxin-antitoxin system RelE/ParE family toxin [Sphingobacteriaceae bacterium]